jgi:hypothetical protein
MMGSFEERLKRLKSVNVSSDGEAEAQSGPAPSAQPSSPRRAPSGGQKREISDKAANLIATALKDFLRD